MSSIPNNQGKLYNFEFPQPAAGANFSGTVPANRRWRIISFSFSFDTDLNAANRQITFDILDPNNGWVWTTARTPAHAANLSRDYFFALIGFDETAFDGNGSIRRNIPELIIRGGSTISLGVLNRQAGDQLQFIEAYVEEWLEP